MPENKPATIRGSVEQQRGNGPKPTVAELVRTAIEAQIPGLAVALPGDIDPERYGRLIVSAIKATPDLMKCFETDTGRLSVILAAHSLAAVGLEPNTLAGDAWLLPRRKGNTVECQAMISFRGMAKMMRRSGIVKGIVADVVRDGDEFEYERGLADDVFRHRIVADDDDRGALTHAYAIVRYTNGGYDLVVLNRKQVEKRRASSASARSDHSPWKTHEEEMWRKSALRALATRSGLLHAADAQAVAFEETTLTVDDGQVVPAEHRVDDDLDAIEAGTIDSDDG